MEFSDCSHVKQCTAIAAVAILIYYNFDLQLWTGLYLEEIVRLGDLLYRAIDLRCLIT